MSTISDVTPAKRNPYRTALGQRVRELRDLRGISQAALADRAGSTQNAVSRLELGLREPSLREGVALARALDVSVEALLHPDQSPPEVEAQDIAAAYALAQQAIADHREALEAEQARLHRLGQRAAVLVEQARGEARRAVVDALGEIGRV